MRELWRVPPRQRVLPSGVGRAGTPGSTHDLGGVIAEPPGQALVVILDTGDPDAVGRGGGVRGTWGEQPALLQGWLDDPIAIFLERSPSCCVSVKEFS